ncbi:MAG: hypothetical protein AMS19_06990 [Gemmatimonas sp. SG8_23]|nr:MAG: hypothetical protein AMS19_06990 [Gemmatimonas sp. SG8_23]
MPSDQPNLTERALEQVQPRIDTFRAAVAAAEAEVREEVMHRAGAQSFKEEQALVELGPFALGRIDPERFSMLLGVSEKDLTPESIDVLSKADAILTGFAESSTHVARVEPGGDLRDVVKDALAHLGQAFGAGRAVELARAGMFDLIEHAYLLGPLPFRLWNRAERHLAPPVVVEVAGEDCLPAGLGEFLDGEVKIVIAARGPTTPAPLARLITPGTYVVQTADPAQLAGLVEARHAGVALLFDEDRPGQAHFTHDPDAGDTTWSRIRIDRMPDEAAVGRGRRPPVWLEELVHLRALAEAPASAGAATDEAKREASDPSVAAGAAALAGLTQASGGGSAPASAEVDPVDRLAAWLLAHTEDGG